MNEEFKKTVSQILVILTLILGSCLILLLSPSNEFNR
jgi:hypothetical protein